MVSAIQRSIARGLAAIVVPAVLLVSAIAAPSDSTALADGAATSAAEAGALFAVIYRPGPSWRDGVPMREQGLGPHGRYMQELLDTGRLFAGGGFADDDGGMAVFRAADIAEARAIVAADPAVTSGIFVGDVEEWRIRFHRAEPLPKP
jgi:uncharacterized protein YciI